MSKDIWHTKKAKPTEDKIIFARHKSFRYGCIECFMWEKQEFTDAIRKDVIAWCYLDDLLALETELDRTKKQLALATKCINWTIDTFQKGLEHEADVAGCCELTMWNIQELEQKD